MRDNRKESKAKLTLSCINVVQQAASRSRKANCLLGNGPEACVNLRVTRKRREENKGENRQDFFSVSFYHNLWLCRIVSFSIPIIVRLFRFLENACILFSLHVRFLIRPNFLLLVFFSFLFSFTVSNFTSVALIDDGRKV